MALKKIKSLVAYDNMEKVVYSYPHEWWLGSKYCLWRTVKPIYLLNHLKLVCELQTLHSRVHRYHAPDTQKETCVYWKDRDNLPK